MIGRCNMYYTLLGGAGMARESSENEITRRAFLKAAGAAAALAGTGISLSPAAAQRASVPANDKIVLGFLGVAGRGGALMDGFKRHPDVEIGAVCDVYETHLLKAVERARGKAKAYSDFRKLLEQKDIDAIVIATPPHWHPIMSILACQAGKDAYCEKPICNYPVEGRAMLKAARDNKRITQVGTQVHASENFRRAVEIVRSGALGKIASVRAIYTLNEYPKGLGRPENCDPPAGLDWHMWLGPAPKVPFNPARFESGQHRYFRDYVGSWLHEMGPHIVDLAYWAMEPGEPLAVSASGGRFIADDISDIPDTMDVLWEFPDFTMSWIHTSCNSFNFGFGKPPDGGRRLGVMFHGSNGTLMADYGTHKVVPEGDRMKDFQPPPPSIPSSPGHEREFLDSIKSRKDPSCSFANHLPLATALNLGHVALNAGRKIQWNSKEGKIIGDRNTERFAYPNYRKPWRLPF